MVLWSTPVQAFPLLISRFQRMAAFPVRHRWTGCDPKMLGEMLGRGLAATSGGELAVGPGARLHAHVERVGRKVGTPGQPTVPVSSSTAAQAKPSGVRASANTGPRMRSRTGLAVDAVGERQRQDAVGDKANVGDTVDQADHRSGSLSTSLSPARAARQFSAGSSIAVRQRAYTEPTVSTHRADHDEQHLEIAVEDLLRHARPLPPHDEMVIEDLGAEEGAAFLAAVDS